MFTCDALIVGGGLPRLRRRGRSRAKKRRSKREDDSCHGFLRVRPKPDTTYDTYHRSGKRRRAGTDALH